MSRDTTVIPFRQPEAIDDPLTEIAREGARRMLAQVLIAEADAFVAQWKDLKLPDGRDRVVRAKDGSDERPSGGQRAALVRTLRSRSSAILLSGSYGCSNGVLRRPSEPWPAGPNRRSCWSGSEFELVGVTHGQG